MNTKITILTVCFTLTLSLSNTIFAQKAFEKDKSTISVGYGFGTLVGSLLKNVDEDNNFTKKVTGPLYLKYEYAISDRIGFGINIAYMTVNVKYVDTVSYFDYAYNYDDNYSYNYNSQLPIIQYDLNYTTYSFLARMNYHFGNFKRFDPYFGFGLGYRYGQWKKSYTVINGQDYKITDFPVSSTNIPFGFETTIGCRFLFTDNIGIYSELGIAKSVFQIGLVGKF